MEKMTDLISSYKQRALEEIETAKLLSGSRLYHAAISRAYYGCYYAINYLLIQNGVETKSHKQAAVEFRKRYIKTEKLGKRYSQILDQLFNNRMVSDYDATIELKEEIALHLIKSAEEFVSTILEL